MCLYDSNILFYLLVTPEVWRNSFGPTTEKASLGSVPITITSLFKQKEWHKIIDTVLSSVEAGTRMQSKKLYNNNKLSQLLSVNKYFLEVLVVVGRKCNTSDGSGEKMVLLMQNLPPIRILKPIQHECEKWLTRGIWVSRQMNEICDG